MFSKNLPGEDKNISKKRNKYGVPSLVKASPPLHFTSYRPYTPAELIHPYENAIKTWANQKLSSPAKGNLWSFPVRIPTLPRPSRFRLSFVAENDLGLLVESSGHYNDRHLQSHGKIGHCEQSNFLMLIMASGIARGRAHTTATTATDRATWRPYSH